MYVIQSKRIYLILFCLVISTIAFNISTRKQESIQTVALPVNNKVIVLDAGHRTEKTAEALVVTAYQKRR
jgi:hypothetical protein